MKNDLKSLSSSYFYWLYSQTDGNRFIYITATLFTSFQNYLMPALMAWFAKNSMDAAVGKIDWSWFSKSVWIFIGVTIIGAFLYNIGNYLNEYAVQNIMHNIRSRFLERFLALPASYHDGHNTGASASALINDLQMIQNIYSSELVGFASRFISMIGAMITITIWQWQLAIVYALIGFIGILFTRRNMTSIRDNTQLLQSSTAAITSHVMERIEGTRTARIFHMEDRLRSGYDAMEGENVSCQRANIRIQAKTELLNMGLALTSIFISLMIGMYLVRVNLTTIGTVLGCSIFMFSNIWVFRSIIQVAGNISQSMGIYMKLNQILEEKTEEELKAQYDQRAEPEPVSGESVIISQLRFGYNENQEVLHNLSFTVNKGEKVVVVGESGAGKSTLLKLLMGLYIPDHGGMSFMGLQYSSVSLDQWRKQVAYVPQDIELMPGSIRDNILMGKPDATKEQLEKAIKLAQLHPFIRQLPDGYHTIIEGSGRGISGGERQRIAIARAFLKDAPILILDEPTASLDGKTADALQEVLFKIMEGRTVFIVSHNERLIACADRKLFIEKGRIRELSA